MRNITKYCFSALGIFAALSTPAMAQDVTFDSGDTAWMLVSSLLVLMMTVPGLALFYGGLVKKDNILATLMQSLAVCAVVSVVWPVIGYSLAFTESNMFIGGLDKFMLNGVTPNSATGSIPESVFIVFQMTFAVITTALLVGAVADRIKFSTLLIFTPLWVILVYAPITHWVWGPGGFIGGIDLEDYEGVLGMGEALDFAGGTVVHINSGVAGLVAAIILGRSLNKSNGPSDSSNLVMSVIGTGLLWVGWFGFNAGSALSAGSSAGYAMLVTNAAAGIAAVTWIMVETLHKGKASVHGAISGVVAGLVAITPAAGFVDFAGSLIMGVISGAVCYVAVSYLKEWLNYDDALDVFGLHGVGGIVGAVLVGVFANPEIGGAAGTLYGSDTQLWAQIISIVVVAVYSAAVTAVLLLILRYTIGLRVQPREEYEGLDMSLHGQKLEV
ncbi:MAG: ammonia channel protein [Micavibrio sp. TMED27]|nr:ammonia channel protein [Micavibrio sp.]OUT92519.1 MAG: ammonia channel protein [Micavibrio sp. TMED27]|tara:strand:+ start:2205 stop:3530 length:1326 start_codon:yes stop_codon:yes gene_type:complete